MSDGMQGRWGEKPEPSVTMCVHCGEAIKLCSGCPNRWVAINGPTIHSCVDGKNWHEPAPAEQPRTWQERQDRHREIENQAASPAEGPRQSDNWRDLPAGYWFFSDSPVCTNRYSVMERTDSGCTAVCSSPWHHQGAVRDLQEIVRLHNAALFAPAAPEGAAPPLTGEKLKEIALRHCKLVAGYTFCEQFDFDAIAGELSQRAVGEVAELRAKLELRNMILDLVATDEVFIQPEEEGSWVFWINVNDMFYPASDGEGIDISEIPAVWQAWKDKGWPGVVRWVQEKRGGLKLRKSREERILTIESLQAQLKAAREHLQWSLGYLKKLVHITDDGAAFIRNTVTELAGFAHKFHEAEAALGAQSLGDGEKA